MTKGIELIAAERQKQIEKHGFTGEHHAQHPEWYEDNQLIQAAIILLLPEVAQDHVMKNMQGQCPENWDKEWFKNLTERTHKERLVIAGALIAAEIDRKEALTKQTAPAPDTR